MVAYKMSYVCAAFNITALLSSLALLSFKTDILAGLFVIGMVFSPLVTVAGILLGIVALILKEPFKKSLIALALNIAFPVVVFSIF